MRWIDRVIASALSAILCLNAVCIAEAKYPQDAAGELLTPIGDAYAANDINVVSFRHSDDNNDWTLVDLTSDDLGDWEPTCDAELWSRSNKLHLLYQPAGLGSKDSIISVLEWNAKALK